MRILVISDLPQFVTGGAEMQAMRLIEKWHEQGHEIICLGRRMGSSPVKTPSGAIETHCIHTFSALGRIGRVLTYTLSLSWLLLRLRHRVDVVYTRFLGEGAATVALLKRWGLLSTPLIATPANTGTGGDITFIRSIPMSNRLIRLLDKECDAINLIAEGMIAELKAEGFSGHNFTTIPNGIYVKPICIRKPSHILRCIAVGRLTPQKGYDVLLQALAHIRAHLSSYEFVIVGDGPERARLERMTEELGLSSQVLWLGELGAQRVLEELELAQLYILPSRYEGMSNAGLEAMERALPVILTCCGGLDCYIKQDMGWVVQPEDDGALAEVILTALNEHHELLRARGIHCRKVVEDLFDIEHTSRRYISLFEDLQRRLRSREVAV
ncbi:glycosyltransferase family 1 protein [Dyella monticola]|uniref:Glycosyltransferase family 1 protein n=1 Tax=Dyella monticola TaxID=1927958 RepID=A0A370X836_9GAMM|nr:glycosyltransferase family 4 protein [Dyella monticola]RDS84526.1 glycosyltransferase family 1 protein [Dyella monticola]